MEVKLAIISPNKNAYSETFIQAHKLIPNVEVKFYYGGNIPTELEGYGKLRYKSESVFSKIGRTLKRKINFVEKWDSLELLKQSFLNEKIQIVLAEYGPTGVAMLDFCKRMEIPLLVHFHGYDASMYDVLNKHGGNYKAMFQYASAIFSVSTVMTQKLVEIGCPIEKIVQNTYGPNPAFLSVKATLQNEEFIAVGRFVDKKAPYYTILAFKEVLSEFPNAQLVMAGNGPLYNTIDNLIKVFKLEKNVKLVGIISPIEYTQYLTTSRAFVQHSITAADGDMEGTPVGILEACAAGVPVISTRHAGITDVIEHNVNGLLCDEHDVEQMTKNMLFVLRDKNQAQIIGQKAKTTIQNQYTLERHLNVISNTIHKHLNQ